MVNTGRPSKDCDSCRQRRVKCDLRRPTCLRCEKVGRECAYRNLDDPKVVFRISTPTSFSKGKTRKKRCDALSPPEKVANPLSGSTNSDSSITPSPAREIVEPWDVHILPLIVHQFSFPSPRGGRIYGSLECFSNLLGKSKEGSILHLACNAVGNAYLSNKSPSQYLTTVHRGIYGDALQVLQQTLNDTRLRNQDDTLLSVWLLCFYELILGTPDGSTGPVNWGIHSKALATLLRSRGKKQFETKTGRQLFQMTYNYIQIQSFQAETGPPPEAQEWFQLIQTSKDAKEFIYTKSFYYGDEASRICKNATTAFEQASSTAERLMIIQEAFECYQILKVPIQKAIEELHGTQSSNKAIILATNERKVIPVLGIRNHMDACMLRTESIILKLISTTSTHSDISIEESLWLAGIQQLCEQESQFAISRIISGMPCFLSLNNRADILSWADTLRLLWPLRCILSSLAAQEAQKEIAKSVLCSIAYDVGIMQAVGSFFTNAITGESP